MKMINNDENYDLKLTRIGDVQFISGSVVWKHWQNSSIISFIIESHRLNEISLRNCLEINDINLRNVILKTKIR